MHLIIHQVLDQDAVGVPRAKHTCQLFARKYHCQPRPSILRCELSQIYRVLEGTNMRQWFKVRTSCPVSTKCLLIYSTTGASASTKMELPRQILEGRVYTRMMVVVGRTLETQDAPTIFAAVVTDIVELENDSRSDPSWLRHGTDSQ